MTGKRITLVSIILFLVLASGSYAGNQYVKYLNTPPAATDQLQTFTVTPGESAERTLIRLQTEGHIRSALYGEWVLRTAFTGSTIQAGEYALPPGMLTTWEIIERITTGVIITSETSVTLPEGEPAWRMGARLAQVLPDFDPIEWEQLTMDAEGRLFPDTYRLPVDFTTEDTVALLRTTHDAVLAELLTSSATTTDTATSTIVNLASILEREANDEESMGLVAGIFYNRLNIGMPLQADATIEYVLNTPLNELAPGQLAAELRELDSPYNTYLYGGLPPTPISNPGRMALEAAINPTPSEYLYYLTGRDGKFYFATTYNEHLRNIERYLR
jgi:UPF0755 protein